MEGGGDGPAAAGTGRLLIFTALPADDARMRPFSQSTTASARVKPPNVAGTFYPGDGEALRREVDACLERARAEGPAPKALIAPHAGYRYSGPVAASAYARLKPRAQEVRRVVLLGPVHYHPVRGVATSGAESFDTPLGAVPVDVASVHRALALAFVHRCDPAFEREHSLEVHLPFLLRVLPRFTLVPLLVGDACPTEIDTLLEALWGGPETVIVVSSDLSHHLDYESARRLDETTSKAIVALRHDAVGYEQACGRHAMNGLLHLAERRGLKASVLDVRNSGDTAGPRDRVVGYGAYAFFEPEPRGSAAGAHDAGGSVSEERGFGMPDREALGFGVSGADAAEFEQSATGVPGPETPGSRTLDLESRRRLLGIATRSIRHGFARGKKYEVDLDGLPPALREHRATFVTLELNQRLRGCIGSLRVRRPLAADVAHNAQAAAFHDPRFPPLEEDELAALDVKVSVLSPQESIGAESEAGLISRLRPGIDGLIIEDGAKRATFLPSVWRGIPEPVRFVRELAAKADWPAGRWPGAACAWRYTTEEFD